MENINTQINKFKLTTPVAILLGFLLFGVILGGSIFWAYNDFKKTMMGGGNVAQQQEPTYELDKMTPVTSADHIKGDPNAKVKIVEYSDTECPFCKRFHFTMNELMNDKDYGQAGKVAWVYRHMPLPMLHQKAQKEAEATECAFEQGGNDKFWAYLDRMMEITPSNDGLESKELVNIAKYVGINTTKFNECLSSGRMAAKVSEHAKNGADTGGNGTPWSIVVGPNQKLPLSGAMPIDVVKNMVNEASK